MSSTLYISPTLATTYAHIEATPTRGAQRWLLTPIKAVGAPLTITHQPPWQFATLSEYLLQHQHTPITIAPSLYALRVVGMLLERLADAGEIPALAAVARKRGMAREAMRWIREMETQGVSPASITAHDPTNPVEQALARLYTVYQAEVGSNYQADTDGIVGAAARFVEEYSLPELAGVHLTVLGFDQFEPMPLRLLAALCRQVAQFDLYLAGDPHRALDALALARLGVTYEQIQHTVQPEKEIMLAFSTAVAPALHHLHTTLFEAPQPIIATDDGVRMVAAPSREAEVRTALRESARLIAAGVEPRAITLLTADPALYQRSVQAVAREYAVPVALSQPLLSNPAVAAWVALLALAPRFPRRETIDALRSPYIQHGFTVEELDMLDRLTRERPVIAAPEQWFAALQPFYRHTERDSSADDDLGPPPLWQTIKPEVMEALREKVRAFFRLLTPPDFDLPYHYGQWITETLLGTDETANASLAIVPTARTFATAERDEAALRPIPDVLGVLNRTSDPRRRIAWENYRADLLDILGDLTVELPTAPNAVAFGAISEGRYRVMPYCFVLGLNEGEFPSLPAPDLFYAPDDRKEHPHLRQEFIGDDASLWWQTLSNTNHTLTLLRPRLDEKGNSTLASPYWAAVVQQFTGLSIEAPRVDESMTWQDAMSTGEQLVAVANGAVPAALPAAVQALWGTVNRAEEIRTQRETRQGVYSTYEGVLHNPTLLAELQRRYGATRDWSVSQLHRYAECPYGFFAQYVLALRPISEPEEGLDPRTLGQIYHAILELLYGWMHETDCLPAPDHQKAILSELDALCDEIFRTAPGRYQFRPGALWVQEQREMRRHLRALVEWECEQNLHHVPYEQERRFGNIAKSHQHTLELEAEGLTFRLQGVIDRIDHAADGSATHIVDYKSGNARPDVKKISEGRALQTALYALALEKMGVQVASSRYVLIRKREESGVLEFDGKVADEPMVQIVLSKVAHFIRHIRAGEFPAKPIEPNKAIRACRDNCELAAICRVTRYAVYKENS